MEINQYDQYSLDTDSILLYRILYLKVKYYDTRTGVIHPRHIVTCMALHEAGERHHENAEVAAGSRLLL